MYDETQGNKSDGNYRGSSLPRVRTKFAFEARFEKVRDIFPVYLFKFEIILFKCSAESIVRLPLCASVIRTQKYVVIYIL